MDINKIKIVLLFTLSCFILMGCRNTTTELDEENNSIIYSNSFEHNADTVGWCGYGARMFKNDAPPQGGKQSIFISGGCIVPHAYYDIKVKNAGDYTIQCWGKVLTNGGGVSLGLASDPYTKRITLSINDSTWKFYSTSDVLFCPSNQSIRVSLFSGGIIAGSMLIDLIEIRKIQY